MSKQHPYSSRNKTALGEFAFWRTPKIQDPKHEDYQRSSEDLPLPPNSWAYATEKYEEEFAENLKGEKKLSIHEKILGR